jgi:hypothetical protein
MRAGIYTKNTEVNILIDLTTIINALIALFSAVITAFLIPLIRSHTSAVQCDRIQSWVKIAVAAAEQIYTGPGKGAEKKSYVLALLNKRGFTYDESSIDALIESSVKMLNITQHDTKDTGGDDSAKKAPAPESDETKEKLAG